jgi:hypothetical protein
MYFLQQIRTNLELTIFLPVGGPDAAIAEMREETADKPAEAEAPK